MAQGKGVQFDLSRAAIFQLEKVSKSTWVDAIVALAVEQLGNADELQILGLVDQWLEPICKLRKMRPPLLQAKYQQALVKRRIVEQEQAYDTKRRGKKARLKASLELWKKE